MSNPDSTSEIESELLAEVQAEMSKRAPAAATPPPELPDTIVSLCLSGLLLLLAVLAGTGVAMALGYAPSADDAPASVAWYELSSLGTLVRAMHWHASNLIVALTLATLGYMAWAGLYGWNGAGRWWRVSGLLLLLLGAGFTGQFLPFDQNALHGTQIRLGYVAETPVFGPMLADFLRAGSEPGTAALSRFHVLHVLVIPVLLLLLLPGLWRDSARGERTLHAGAMAAVGALILLAALVWPAPLGLSGTLSEAYNDARPEWYALPLYEMLRMLPGGFLQTLALTLPPLMTFGTLAALPVIERAVAEPERLQLPVRVGLGVAVAGALVLSAVSLWIDASEGQGWFAKPEIEQLMLQMGQRNDALGHEDGDFGPNAHLHAHDLRHLYSRLPAAAPEDLEPDALEKWREWAEEGAALALDLFTAPDDTARREARTRLRENCVACHDAHEVEVLVSPVRPAVATGVTRDGVFDLDRAASLEPSAAPPRSTKRVMDQMSARMRDILAATEIVDDNASRSLEQALVDLRQLGAHAATLWEDNAGSWFAEDKWDAWARDVQRAIDDVAHSPNRDDLAMRMAALGRACEACHDGGDEPDAPIEWRYMSLLQ
jgi:quinol-cytochrome oxidoreductase complex cytochrome b subunit